MAQSKSLRNSVSEQLVVQIYNLQRWSNSFQMDTTQTSKSQHVIATGDATLTTV